MKKRHFLSFVILALPLASCFAQKAWKIDGTTVDVPKTTTIYFNKAIDGDLVPLDSAKAANGKFSFNGTTDKPEVRYLSFRVGGKTHWAEMFVEEGNIKATLTMKDNSVRGTVNNDIYQDLKDRPPQGQGERHQQ